MQAFKLLYPASHTIRRSSLFEDVVKLFSNDVEYPLRIHFENERAVDQGGVSRDMLSGFWEQAYTQIFDGCTLLTPVIHPQSDMQVFPVIGRILSYGYLACSFVPLRIAFPTLLCLLLGPTTAVADSVLLETFPDCLSNYECAIIKEAVNSVSFSQSLKTKVVGVLSRFGCREVPTHNNIKDVIVKVARFEFMVKPLAAISLVHSGIPTEHIPFWQNQTVKNLSLLYSALTATPAKVVEILQSEPTDNACEERVMSYLEQFVGNMNKDMLRKFLRFATGSSVCLSKKITVAFNNLSGFARRPISHTCGSLLELSSSYSTYPEFVGEFEEVLAQPESYWVMDAL